MGPQRRRRDAEVPMPTLRRLPKLRHGRGSEMTSTFILVAKVVRLMTTRAASPPGRSGYPIAVKDPQVVRRVEMGRRCLALPRERGPLVASPARESRRNRPIARSRPDARSPGTRLTRGHPSVRPRNSRWPSTGPSWLHTRLARRGSWLIGGRADRPAMGRSAHPAQGSGRASGGEAGRNR